MCVALFSTAHPDYALILINNRDEYLNRPTAPAHWWDSPNGHVLGGRDLLRKEQGTWLGMTRQGRIAVLTNFREEGSIPIEARSRGAMVTAFLAQHADSPSGTEQFVKDLVHGDGLKGVGGFSLVCGNVGEPLAVLSNRTPNVESVSWIAKTRKETTGLSNAAFANRSWAKVLDGEALMASAIKSHATDRGSKTSLVADMFRVLNTDTLPRRSQGTGWESYVKELRNSIFIPAIGGEGAEDMSAEDLATATSNQHLSTKDPTPREDEEAGKSGVYGTQKQTVVLIDHQGKVTFVERTLYDATGRRAIAESHDRTFEFDVEGWRKDTTPVDMDKQAEDAAHDIR